VFVEKGAKLHNLALRAGELYVAAIGTNKIHRLTVSSSDGLTAKDSFGATNPASLTFSRDGLELFTAGNADTGPIERFEYDESSDRWTKTADEGTPGALGSILVLY
jgi:hypothetical protein